MVRHIKGNIAILVPADVVALYPGKSQGAGRQVLQEAFEKRKNREIVIDRFEKMAELVLKNSLKNLTMFTNKVLEQRMVQNFHHQTQLFYRTNSKLSFPGH